MRRGRTLSTVEEILDSIESWQWVNPITSCSNSIGRRFQHSVKRIAPLAISGIKKAKFVSNDKEQQVSKQPVLQY